MFPTQHTSETYESLYEDVLFSVYDMTITTKAHAAAKPFPKLGPHHQFLYPVVFLVVGGSQFALFSQYNLRRYLL